MTGASGSLKLDWPELPALVRRSIEHRLGGRVVASEVQRGGFSPAATVRVRLDDGRRAFLKSVSSDINADSLRMYRAEAELTAQLAGVPGIPALLEVIEDDPWITLIFEDIEGRMPDASWPERDLTRVLEAMVDLHAALTPSPVAAPTAAEGLAELFDGWSTIVASDELAARLRPPWTAADAARIQQLERGWDESVVGETLLHLDVRSDNVLLTDERVWFVDWVHSMVGAAAVDALAMFPSIAAAGAWSIDELLALSPETRDLPDDAVVAVLSGLAGFFIAHSLRPAPRELPTLRDFQAHQGYAVLDWLRPRV